MAAPRHYFFGASHVKHLRDYISNIPVDSVEKKAYNRAKYVTVGGLSWSAILRHIKGEKLSERNKHLGNQWAEFLRSKHNTLYMVIILGSNDVDSLNRKTCRIPGVKTPLHMK